MARSVDKSTSNPVSSTTTPQDQVAQNDDHRVSLGISMEEVSPSDDSDSFLPPRAQADHKPENKAEEDNNGEQQQQQPAAPMHFPDPFGGQEQQQYYNNAFHTNTGYSGYGGYSY